MRRAKTSVGLLKSS